MNQAAYRLEQTKLTDSNVFRDAVHNYIHVDQPLILDLINSHEMQRLQENQAIRRDASGLSKCWNIRVFVIL